VTDTAWDDGIEGPSLPQSGIRVIVRCDTKTADRSSFFARFQTFQTLKRLDVCNGVHELCPMLGARWEIRPGEKYVGNLPGPLPESVMCRIKDTGQRFCARGDKKHEPLTNPSYDPDLHAIFRENQGLRPGGYGGIMRKHWSTSSVTAKGQRSSLSQIPSFGLEQSVSSDLFRESFDERPRVAEI